jgi:hypothetical protein
MCLYKWKILNTIIASKVLRLFTSSNSQYVKESEESFDLDE